MYNGSYAVKVKPIKTVEYKYPMIQFLYYNSQLFNEAEYDEKNYADWGEC